MYKRLPGQSFIQCPLTVDTDVLNNLINEINVADREYDGTAIGMAIANATNRLRDSEAKSKIMILLSDGSNNAGEIDPGQSHPHYCYRLIIKSLFYF